MNHEGAALAGALILCAMFATLRCECDNAVERNVMTFVEEFDNLTKQLKRQIKEANWDFSVDMSVHNFGRTNTNAGKESQIEEKAEEGSSVSLDDLCSNATRIELEFVLDHRDDSVSESDGTLVIANRVFNSRYNMSQKRTSFRSCKNDKDGKCLMYQSQSNSQNESEIRRVWIEKKDESGRQVRPYFESYVTAFHELLNKTDSDYKKKNQKWRAPYEKGDAGFNFEDDLESLMGDVKPLLRQIMAFFRRRLKELHSDYNFNNKSLFPAHMVYRIGKTREYMPFRNKQIVDVTDELKRQNYTALSMFRKAEEYFTSLNLSAMTDRFWNKSMLVKPNHQVNCDADACHFGDGEDFRIRMCTKVNQDDFFTIHRQMLRIEYFMAYRNQSFVFQKEPYPEFETALAEALTLSVGTTKHLKAIGLIDQNTQGDNESDINALMTLAINTVLRLPYCYVTDKYERDVLFNQRVASNKYNKYWWDLSCTYSGLVPPNERSEEVFDPTALPDVIKAGTNIKYFVRTVLQFQFHEALCNATNHTGPLYKCDLYNKTVAGNKLRDMMQPGASLSWPDALHSLTGRRRMDMGSLLRYFQPLKAYLEGVNRGQVLDWDGHCNAINYLSS